MLKIFKDISKRKKQRQFLLNAIYNKDLEAIQNTTSQNIDLSKYNYAFYTVRHGTVDILKHLIKEGADIKERSLCVGNSMDCDDWGVPPLIQAMCDDKTDMIKEILEHTDISFLQKSQKWGHNKFGTSHIGSIMDMVKKRGTEEHFNLLEKKIYLSLQKKFGTPPNLSR